MRVITLNDDQALIYYAKPSLNELHGNMVRVDSQFSATPFEAKIANAEPLRVHTRPVIGAHDMEAGAVSVRLHGNGNLGLLCPRQCRRHRSLAEDPRFPLG